MAMLAEPRRKIRYTINPTGRDWIRTTSGGNGASEHFGHKMLHSMGWREGQGLGKDGQGEAEPIRVKRKNDQRGIGCSGAYAAESMPQNVDFASLLSQLNEAHGPEAGCQSNGDADPSTGATVSLEAKSRSSRARLHYRRFTRAKDVSAYDKQSLACIFGSRKDAETVEGDGTKTSVQEEDADERVGFGFATMKHSQSEACLAPEREQKNEHGLQLVQSQTSLQDYFRVKMQERLQKQQQQQQQTAEQQPDDHELEEAASSWTSESSCSAASTVSIDAVQPALLPPQKPSAAMPQKQKMLEEMPPHQSSVEAEPPLVVIDFGLFPGCAFQNVLGYPLY